MPTLYEWHYNPKFTKIPIEEAFGNGGEKGDKDNRGSFYLELVPNQDMIEKFSVCGFDYESLVLQERPVDRIYESSDCQAYLEDFDF